jgi:hypothetical protein
MKADPDDGDLGRAAHCVPSSMVTVEPGADRSAR